MRHSFVNMPESIAAVNENGHRSFPRTAQSILVLHTDPVIPSRCFWWGFGRVALALEQCSLPASRCWLIQFISHSPVLFFVSSTLSLPHMQDPSYLFVVDVSLASIKSGLMLMALQSIRNCLDVFAANPRIRMGVVTYDSAVQFYRMRVRLRCLLHVSLKHGSF